MTAPCTMAHHEALKLDDAAWSRLRYVGLQLVPAGADSVAEPAYTVELRDCACGSTIGRAISCE